MLCLLFHRRQKLVGPKRRDVNPAFLHVPRQLLGHAERVVVAVEAEAALEGKTLLHCVRDASGPLKPAAVAKPEEPDAAGAAVEAFGAHGDAGVDGRIELLQLQAPPTARAGSG